MNAALHHYELYKDYPYTSEADSWIQNGRLITPLAFKHSNSCCIEDVVIVNNHRLIPRHLV